MLTNILENFSLTNLILCMVCSLISGLLIAITHKYTSKYTKGYLTTISVLPFLVFVVIVLVNGNLGTGVAIMGAFSLVRFRSLPGSAKEILTIFFAMSVGLAYGTGYLLFAGLITIIGCLVIFIYDKVPVFEKNTSEKILRIVIPEDLDYTSVFDDTFKKYTKKVELERVKTIDLGSMFELKYLITLKNKESEKKFIDELRIKNGNLKILLSHSIEDSEL